MDFKTRNRNYAQSRYAQATPAGLAVFREIDTQKIPTFAIASSIISYEGAQLAFLFSRLCNRLHDDQLDRTSYFTNSTLDAIFAVMRLARETANTNAKYSPAPSDILVLDEDGTFAHLLSAPGGTGDARLYPGIYYANRPDNPILSQDIPWAALIPHPFEKGGLWREPAGPQSPRSRCRARQP